MPSTSSQGRFGARSGASTSIMPIPRLELELRCPLTASREWGCTETSAWDTGPDGEVNADGEAEVESREDGKMGVSFRSASRRRTTSPARAVISASSSAGGWRCGFEDWRVAVEGLVLRLEWGI
jgi:hypothetical protein